MFFSFCEFEGVQVVMVMGESEGFEVFGIGGGESGGKSGRVPLRMDLGGFWKRCHWSVRESI